MGAGRLLLPVAHLSSPQHGPCRLLDLEMLRAFGAGQEAGVSALV